MEYRKMGNTGVSPSLLGFGCMRFPTSNGKIDEAEAERMLDRAIGAGVTYLDTAYPYHNGDSEPFVGRILKKYDRSSLYLATKLPMWKIKTLEDAKETFEEQLKRLDVDYVDFYLLHALDGRRWEQVQELKLLEYCEQLKKEGKIRWLGFSFHDDYEAFEKILTGYGWDFCQIQYNYLDEHTQAGRKGLQAAAEKGIPVIIMEPLRGGKLVNLPEKAKKMLASESKGYTPAELGLRWLWDQPEVTCVLSGMNSEEMVKENIHIASEAMPGHLTEEDQNIVERIKTIIREREKVGCTGCRYCMPCPKGVDIPGNFYYYNLMYMEKKSSARFGFVQNMGLRKEPGFASQCVGCRKCEKHCPQNIPICDKLKEADRELRPLLYRIVIHVARKIMLR